MAGEPLDAAAVPAGPKPFNIPTMDLPSEAEIRAIASTAEASGESVVTIPQKDVTQTPGIPQAPQAPAPVLPQPIVPQAAAAPAELTPQAAALAKFLKPDGTVDVEKLQASSKQLDEALQSKVLSIEEMVGQYLQKEKDFRNIPTSQDQVARAASQIAAQQPVNLAQVPMPQIQPVNPNALHAQLMQDYERDPLGTIVDLVKAINSTENKQINEFVTNVREQQHVESRKQSLVELAKSDPRVSHPTLYQELLAEMGRDPGYFKLRNPYKAAWNEVKERLRLGESNTSAQPSKPASPILGGGSPPPVPSTAGSYGPATLQAAIGAMKTKDEMALVEAELRKLSMSMSIQ